MDVKEKHKRPRGYFAWRNGDWWIEQKPTQWRLHRQGQLFAPEFREKQEELFNDINVSKQPTKNGTYDE